MTVEPSQKNVLILKTGESLPTVKARRGDYDDWIAAGLGRPIEHVQTVSVFEGESLPSPESVDAVIVTGSAEMVSARLPWSEDSAVWLAEIIRGDVMPVLGVCYGHQLMAHGLGGEVGPNPRGREMGTVDVFFDSDDSVEGAGAGSDGLGPLFEAGTFPAHMSHVESVLTPPSGAKVLARTLLEPHAVLQFGPRQWGVQFHPEFDRDILHGYVEARREILTEEGLAPEEMIEALVETPDLTRILERFAAFVERGDG